MTVLSSVRSPSRSVLRRVLSPSVIPFMPKGRWLSQWLDEAFMLTQPALTASAKRKPTQIPGKDRREQAVRRGVDGHMASSSSLMTVAGLSRSEGLLPETRISAVTLPNTVGR